MASRKEQKEALRQQRIAEQQALAARARREQRLRMLAGVVIGAVAVVAVAIAISAGGANGGGLQTGKKLKATEAAVSSLLRGVPQSGNVLGNPNAPVTMTYYGDLECPICRSFTIDGGFGQLVQNEVRDGKVKVVYSALKTATDEETVFTDQQVAALAAGRQNKFWNYAELFYRQQGAEGSGYVDEHYLNTLARQAGLNISAWKAARTDKSLAAEVTAQGSSGLAHHISGTPTLVFSGPKGTAQAPSGVPSYSDLQSAYNAVA
jgi:protein-disulfide isomerase